MAARLGLHRTRVSNWQRPKERGGSGGRIPQSHHRALIAIASELDVPLSADDLLPAASTPPSETAADSGVSV